MQQIMGAFESSYDLFRRLLTVKYKLEIHNFTGVYRTS